MTIEIHSPEAEAIIRQRMSSGGFRTPEDVVIQALTSSIEQTSEPKSSRRAAGRKSLAQLFADSPLKGLDINFERTADFGRDIKL